MTALRKAIAFALKVLICVLIGLPLVLVTTALALSCEFLVETLERAGVGSRTFAGRH